MEFGEVSVSCFPKDFLEPADKLTRQIRIDGGDSVSGRGCIKIERLQQQAATTSGTDVKLRAGQNPVDGYRQRVRDGKMRLL
jgi:hypothetical protein